MNKTLIQDKSNLTNFSWSSDGELIVLIRGVDQIVIINKNGDKVEELAKGDCPSWVPNKKEVVLERNGQIIFIDLDSRKERILRIEDTQIGSAPKRNPLFSPQGDWLIFLVDKMSIEKRNILRTKFASSSYNGEKSSLFSIESHGGIYTWSPNGDRVACHSWDCKGGSVYITDRTGQIHGTMHGYNAPSFSLTGDYLACRTDEGISVFDKEWKEPIVSVKLKKEATYDFNPIFWYDETNIMLEHGGIFWKVNIKTGDKEEIFPLPNIVKRGIPAMSITPDRKSLLYEEDKDGSSLSLVSIP